MNKFKFASGLAIIPFALSYAQPETQRPNIIFIMSDDHAEQAISAYGHPVSQLAPTPNIDKIAQSGALFMNNYCCNSISGPSRAAILTGKHSHRNGFMQNGSKGFDGSQTTLPKILQQNGYQTAIIGKWHLVSKPTGFDYWKILNDQGDYYNPYFITEQDTLKYPGYVTSLITNFTEEWLDNRDKNKPFFLMMHHKAPHRNWVPEEKYYHLYENTQFPLPETYFDNYEGRDAASKQKMNIYRDMFEGHDLKMVKGINSDSLLYDPWPANFLGTMTLRQQKNLLEAYRDRNNKFYEANLTESQIAEWKYQRYLQDYLATIRSVDDSVGELLDYLKTTGLDKNTIVVYCSDQGFYLGEHGWFDKRFMYEESFGMPLMMSYPGHITPGTQVTELTQNIDFAPTLLDFCGIKAPEEMQGISVTSLVDKNATGKWQRDALYYHYYEFPGFHDVRAHYGIKTKRYKLMFFYKENNWELYDLEKDPHEMHNLYGTSGMKKVQKELHAQLKVLQEQYAVPQEFCR